jgi:hypothetical protein
VNASFLSGAIMLAAAAVSLFFFRSWGRTRDRLFLFFGVAFGLLALERWALELYHDGHGHPFSVYLLRLAAFVIIVTAIVDKNSTSRAARSTLPPG